MTRPPTKAAGSPVECCTPREVVNHGHVRVVPCGARSCPACGVLWLGDTRVRVLAAAQELHGAVALVTVTAPGADRLPWDESGTRVEEQSARWWNEEAPANWSDLHRAAAKEARRVAAAGGRSWRLLIKTWEYQRRGVLHLHLVVPAGDSVRLAASEAYVRALARLAPSHGFGFVDRGKLPKSGRRASSRRLEPVAPHRAAAYVASYVASGGAGKEGIAEVARKQGVPGAVVYVSPSLTRRSGVTMRSLRARRRIVCRFPGADESAEAWRAATVADGLSRRRAPLTPAARGHLMRVALAQSWGGGFHLDTGEWAAPTDAAPPPRLRGSLHALPPARRVGAVRLDPVLHHGTTGGHRAIWSEVSEAYAAT